MLAKGVTGGLGLVISAILIRKLGAEVYGQFILISSVMVLFDSLADFGTRIIGVREMAKEKEIEKKNGLWSNFFWVRLGLATIVFGGGMIGVFGWKGFEGIRTEALVALSMIWLTSMAGSLEMVFQERMKMELKVVGEIAYPLLFLVIVTRLVEINLLLVMAIYWLSRLVSVAIEFKVGKLGKISWINSDKVVKIFKESWPMGLYLIIFTAYDRAVDSLMIERMIGIREVAWYGVAYKIYAVLLQPAYFFVSSLFPLQSRVLGEEEKENLFKKSVIILITGGMVVVLLMWFLAPLAIGLLTGGGFEESVLLLRILLGAVVASYFGHLFGFRLISEGKQMKMLKLGAVVLVFNISVNYLLIGNFGVNGAAWTTLMTEMLGCGLMAVGLKNKKI